MSAWARTTRCSPRKPARWNSAKASNAALTYRSLRRICRPRTPVDIGGFEFEPPPNGRLIARGKVVRHLPFFVPSEEGTVMSCCRLETERLLLRKPEEADVPAITAMIGDWDVVKNLATAPYPYLEDHARQFIARVVEGS